MKFFNSAVARLCMAVLCMALLFVGCKPVGDNSGDVFDDPDSELPENNDNDGNNEPDPDDPSGTGKDDNTDTTGGDDSLDISEFDKAITLVWNGDDVSITNGSKLSVTNNGAHVTIGAPGAEGKKVRINLSGSTTNGSLKIYNGVKADDTNKKMLLSFEGVSLKSAVGPAINIQSGKTVYVLVNDGTKNYLCDGATYTDTVEGEDAKGCFFSEKQLVFCGKGELEIEGKNKHAICVDDYIHIMDGNITVKSAESDGLHTNDYVQVDGGVLTVNSKGEAVQCESAELGYFYMTGGELVLNPAGEKSHGIQTASDIILEGGKVNIIASGAAAKCLKSDNNIDIKDAEVTLKTTGAGVYDATERDTAASACMRAENNVVLKSGTITCTSTGNGGKGINCYSFECNEGVDLSVTTSGGVYSYSSYKSRPKAIKATKLVTINGGNINIKTTGTEGEGMESKDAVVVNGGSLVIIAKDDGINASGVITFNGGYTYVQSTGNDGIDTNNGRPNSIVVNGGVVMAHSAASPEEAFDADNHAYLTFNGGFIFCTGGQQGGGGGGRPGPGGGGWGGGGTSSNNPVCSQTTYMWNTSASAGYFTVVDNAGKVVMSCYVPRALSTNYSFISAPFVKGSTYKCGFTSGKPSGATTVFGDYFFGDGSFTGSLNKTFTAGTGYATL